MTNSTLEHKGLAYAIFEVGEDDQPIHKRTHTTQLGERYMRTLERLQAALPHDPENVKSETELWDRIGFNAPEHYRMTSENQLSPVWRHVLGKIEALDEAYGGEIPTVEIWEAVRKSRREFQQREDQRTFHFDYSDDDSVIDLLRERDEETDVVWGDAGANHIPWVRGEPAMIFGANGSFKTTITHNLLCGLAGIAGYDRILGLPVEPLAPGETVLYLALDRPEQAKRSLDRFLRDMTPGERDQFARVVEARAVLPDELRDNPAAFAEWVARYPGNVRVVIIEHARNVWGNLAQPDRATTGGDAITRLMTIHGIDSLTLNHTKELGGRTYVAGLSDSYGGSNFYNPMGTIQSVEARGDLLTMKQWKEPRGLVMPKIKAKAEFASGRLVVKGAGMGSLLEDGRWHDITELTRAEVGPLPEDRKELNAAKARVRRSLAKLVESGEAEESNDGYGKKWRGTK